MVSFTQDKAVEIIQSSWIRARQAGKKLRAVWPINFNNRNINTIVQDDQSIEDPVYVWKTFGINILYESGKLRIFHKFLHHHLACSSSLFEMGF